MHTLMHLLVLSATLLVLSRAIPGVHIKSPGTAIAVSVVFSVLNFSLAWVVRAALFVPSVLSLGLLFLFVPFIVNTVLLWLTDKVMPSFEISSARGLFVSAAAITVVNGLCSVLR